MRLNSLTPIIEEKLASSVNGTKLILWILFRGNFSNTYADESDLIKGVIWLKIRNLACNFSDLKVLS